MASRSLHLLSLLMLLGTVVAAAPVDGQQKWALLIAGSNGYYNYRHQADICHAYHILLNHGIPASNIVTMMYDDIAHNSENPFPGQIFNSPKRVDVYGGVHIDYKGDDVNKDVFLSVLKGEKAAVNGKGTGRVIESGAEDNVFVYYADHGGTGIIGMPAGDLMTKDELWSGLDYLYTNKRYSKLVFYMEACESGSMFDGFPSDREVYAMTASNPDESSWGCYCSERDLPCLGDEFSVQWMRDSEQNAVNKESLLTQFADTKKATTKSHVCKYGSSDFLSEPVGDFQGSRCDGLSAAVDFEAVASTWAVQDIPLREIEKRIENADNEESREEFREELRVVKENRERVANLYRSIAQRVLGNSDHFSDVVSVRPKTISQMKCHREVVGSFEQQCLRFSKNPFAFQHAFVLANLCEKVKSAESINAAIKLECNNVSFNNVI